MTDGKQNTTRTPWQEHVVAFLRREGSVSTAAIGHRFGWDTREARLRLNVMRKAGMIESKREIFDTGPMNGWQVSCEQGATREDMSDRARNVRAKYILEVISRG